MGRKKGKGRREDHLLDSLHFRRVSFSFSVSFSLCIRLSATCILTKTLGTVSYLVFILHSISLHLSLCQCLFALLDLPRQQRNEVDSTRPFVRSPSLPLCLPRFNRCLDVDSRKIFFGREAGHVLEVHQIRADLRVRTSSPRFSALSPPLFSFPTPTCSLNSRNDLNPSNRFQPPR